MDWMTQLEAWLRRWFAPRSRNQWQALRERVIYTLSLPLLVVFALLAAVDGMLLLVGEGAVADLLADLFGMVSMAAVYAITRRGWIRLGSLSLVFIYLDLVVFYILRQGSASINSVLFVVAIIASGFALGWLAAFIVATVSTSLYGLAAFLEVQRALVPFALGPLARQVAVFGGVAYLCAALVAVFERWSYRSMRGYAHALARERVALQAADRERRMLVQSLQEQVAAQRQLVANLSAEREEQVDVRAALRELATPVMPILDRVVVAPVVGDLDADRAEGLLRDVLDGVEQHEAWLAILDLTAVSRLDGSAADGLRRLVDGAGLVGAECVLAGVRPAVARAMLDLDVPPDVICRRDLQSALRYALQRAGARIVPLSSRAERDGRG
ncbi:MAG: STAS domain-containing protein [Anaerolineae bacterium]|nr:STAS domain-containing protein [Anaerolineae bacterium]